METPNSLVYLTGREGEEFDPEVSANWIKNHSHKHPGDPVSHFFGKEILHKLLAQPGCVGLRFYYAHSKPLSSWQRSMVAAGNFFTKVLGNIEGEKHLIIMGAAGDGSDQKPSKNDKTAMKFMVAQQGIPCPGSPGCPPA